MNTCLLSEKEVENYIRFPLYSSSDNESLINQKDEHDLSCKLIRFSKEQSKDALAKLACIINGQRISLGLKNAVFSFDKDRACVRFNNKMIFYIMNENSMKDLLRIAPLYADEVYRGFGELIVTRLNNALER